MKKLSKKINIVVAIAISFVICIANYFFYNCPYPFWDNLKIFCWADYVAQKLLPKEDNRNDVLFVNVAHDKKVIDAPYIGGMPVKKVITDRKVLSDFLCIVDSLHKSGIADYKCVFLDVMLEQGFADPENDSLLFSKIKEMDNVFFTRRHGKELLDNTLDNKAYYNNYYTSIIETNFTRYQFIQDGKISAPLGLYSNQTGNSIIKRGPLFFPKEHDSGIGTLCYNSPMIYIPNDFYNDNSNSDSSLDYEIDFPYYDFGPFQRTFGKEIVVDELADKLDGKMVIVGDFINDVHDTYKGIQPGPWIVYLAYRYLAEGKHLVNRLQMLFFLMVYFLISLSILYNKGIPELLKGISFIRTSRLMICLTSFLTYGLILIILNVTMYIFFDTIINIFIPCTIFSLLELLLSFRKA